MSSQRMIIAAALLAAAASTAPAPAQVTEPAFTIGGRTTVLADKAGGLSMFPEAPITILKTSPQYEVLIPAAMQTAYCKGPSMDKLVGTGFALSPSTARSYDRVSAHITSVWTDPASGDLYGVVSANDSDDVPRIPGPGIGYRGRYYTAALAKSTNGGASFSKIGPILSVPKNATNSAMQGNAFGSVVMSPDKKWLYLFYGDMFNGMLNGGIQTMVARASVESKGLPGSWKKWYGGDWSTPGISTIDSASGGGCEATPVVGNHVSLYGDAMHPSVSYSAKLGAYVMVYVINVPDETPEPDSLGKYPPVDLSGIYIAFSKDALSWGGRKQLVKAVTIDYPGREVAMHPTLVIDEAATTATRLKATLYYGYSANMWWGTPATQYLVSQSVDADGLSETQWPSGLRPDMRPPQSRRAPAYSLHKSGNGSLILRFTSQGNGSEVRNSSGITGLRLVRADGAAAGAVASLGQGLYLLDISRTSGPLFLQGRQDGHVFTTPLRRP